ncbi:MAG: hypothetical protein ACXQS2_06110 [Methermicoccaceae archaeon]
MPKDFERCVRTGGRVRTKKLSGGKYIKICYKDGKSYAGEVHRRGERLARAMRGRR